MALSLSLKLNTNAVKQVGQFSSVQCSVGLVWVRSDFDIPILLHFNTILYTRVVLVRSRIINIYRLQCLDVSITSCLHRYYSVYYYYHHNCKSLSVLIHHCWNAWLALFGYQHRLSTKLGRYRFRLFVSLCMFNLVLTWVGRLIFVFCVLMCNI